MIRLDFNSDTITPRLLEAVAQLSDMTPLMQKLGELMVSSTEDNFRQGTSPDGVVWAPKSMATIEAYRKREGRGSNAAVPFAPLIGKSRSLSQSIAYTADATSMQWGSNMIYAAVMQLGANKGQFGRAANNTPIPWGNIPARPFIGVGQSDEIAILQTIAEYLD